MIVRYIRSEHMQPPACPVVLKQRNIWDLSLLLPRQPNGREVVPRIRHLKKRCIPNVQKIMKCGQRMQVVIGGQ